MKTYSIYNKNNKEVYYCVNETKLKALENKIKRYGWKIEEHPIYKVDWSAEHEVWNEGWERSSWAI